MFDKTITLYNKRLDPVTKGTIWPKVEITGVSWSGHQRVAIGEGLFSNDGYSVRIPVGSMPEGFLKRDEYQNTSLLYPKWEQPTGAADDYSKGDRVSHDGKNWTSLIDGNIWEPGIVMTPIAWEVDSFRYWTAQNGDIVLLGIGPEVDKGITEVTKRFTDCFTVTTVKTANLARLLSHLRLEGT